MIKLKDNYYIMGDEKCYQLTLDTGNTDKRTGATLYKPLGYYSSIEDLIKGFIKMMSRKYLNTKELQTINQLIEYQKKLNEEIKQNLNCLQE